MSKVRTDAEDERSGSHEAAAGESLVRIGELARRSGTSAPTLRAWERRYGVLRPRRGDSGYRLYSRADERRVRGMVDLIAQGLAPAEAAKRIRAGAAAAPPDPEGGEDAPVVEGLREALLDSLIGFDEVAANQHLDRAVGTLSVSALLGEIVLPALREIGERWTRSEVTIGQEHFASALLRGRLLALARGWGSGEGNLVLLACPSGERHDLGVIACGLELRELGWRVAFLGADTPVESIRESAAQTRPEVVVIFAMDGRNLSGGAEAALEAIATATALLLAGSGAEVGLCRRVGAVPLAGGPLEAAHAITV